MRYLHIDFPTGITFSVSSFYPQGGGRGEHHMVFSSEKLCGNSIEKINAIIETFKIIKHKIFPHECLTPVFSRWFVSDAANQEKEIPLDLFECATSIIQQPPAAGSKIGVWVYCVGEVKSKPLGYNRFAIESSNYIHYWEGDQIQEILDPEEACEQYLQDYARWIEKYGCNLTDNCLRTWYFVKDIDLNYKGLVSGRNKVFEQEGLTTATHFIASTGIGGRKSSAKQTLVFNAYSVKGLQPGQITYLKAPTHLNSTMEYGVAFERGTTIDYGDRRHAIISGTASINKEGEITHPGNVRKQCLRMLENVEKLLEEASMDLQDMMHAIVYLRDFSDYNEISRILDEKLIEIPKIIVEAPVCRSGWLIEMECMAIKAQECQFAPF